jgi:hypothetical protein
MEDKGSSNFTETTSSEKEEAKASVIEGKEPELTAGDLPNLFNVKKPKDIRDGLGNCLGNVATGIILFI